MVESKTLPPDGSTAGRAHETRVVIDAPIAEVWKAITDADALARWFAPKMTVEPGAGGSVLADWGPGMEWKTLIEVWEPNRHLRLVETRERVLSSSPVEERLEPCRLVEDFYLETEGGKTVLRLVHSGFGSSAAWDTEFEGTRGGWPICFLRLKYGLERHRNESVQNILLPAVCHGMDPHRALERIESATPQPLQVVFRGDSHFCGLLPERNGSFFSASTQAAPIGAVAYVEILLFGLPESEAAALKYEWKARLEEMFPPVNGKEA